MESKYSHIIDDGHLDKLDLEVAYADPRAVESIYPESLRKMEPASRVKPFTAEDVVECLHESAKAARKQLEDYFANVDMSEQYRKWKRDEAIRDIKFYHCPARVNKGPTSVWNTEATVEDHANDLKEFIEAINKKE